MSIAARPIKRISRQITGAGTITVDAGFAVEKVALTVKGVGSAASAWNVSVKGRPWADDTSTADAAPTVTIDDHVGGVEADGACVQSAAVGVITNLDIVTTVTLGSATALSVEIVLLGY